MPGKVANLVDFDNRRLRQDNGVAVLDKGHVVEFGPQDALEVQPGSLYHSLLEETQHGNETVGANGSVVSLK